MGLFKRSSKSNEAKSDPFRVDVYLGDTPLRVVGESYRQDELKKLLESGGREVLAVLIPEPKNQYDPNAIMVWATSRDGKVSPMHVGYLSQRDAAQYIFGLMELMIESDSGSIGLYAKIIGGEPNKSSLGILLLHDPEDFNMDDEYEDDDYNEPEWLRNLPEDRLAAIPYLRNLLSSETDVVIRHEVFEELESALYKSRDIFDSALSQYDEVCRDHDSEMEDILPKLVGDTGKVPFLTTYRQMAIRKQKQHDWNRALWWAKRGIELYGDRPEDPDDLADLQYRAKKYEDQLT